MAVKSIEDLREEGLDYILNNLSDNELPPGEIRKLVKKIRKDYQRLQDELYGET